MTILIVEDHKAVRRLIRREVEELAAEVFECENGDAAFAAYATHRPDVVLMDIQMPGVDGLTATRRIKQMYPDARIIFVTDYEQSEFRAAAEEVGACGYVTKSDLSALKDLIAQAVAQ
ncbi:MAG TPA: response regulator [Candidatus Saccharimonadales bacterium]|nr:response regulator [Candidatus Saccharimonadales bacterium]